MRGSCRRGGVQAALRLMVVGLVGLGLAATAAAKDLGDILVEKGLITADELRQAREEEKQKAAVEESRRDAIATKLPGWLAMVTPFGDLRVRAEGFYANDLNARNRARLRARLGVNINPSDEIGGTIRIASGNADDPISTNQILRAHLHSEGGQSRPGLHDPETGQDLRARARLGQRERRQDSAPTYRTSELLWDDDLSPEGATKF